MTSSRPRRPARQLSGSTLVRLFGIELQIHPSWLISLFILSYYAYIDIAPSVVRPDSEGARLLVALLFAILIAVCIVAHELSHSLVARVYGLPVKRITLFAFGGVSQIEREAPHPRAEFSIALAGPLSSVVIACVLAGISRVIHPAHSRLPGLWGQLGALNMYLALFNLIPAFPMDGGRVLRSGLWALGSRARATRWAVAVGRSFAMLAVGGGAVLLLAPPLLGQDSGGSAGALWIIFIGLFIFNAAGAAGKIEGGERPNQQSPMMTGLQTGPPERKPDQR
jgi:Zn-dependent protease